MSACVPTRKAISPDATHFRSCAREIGVASRGFTFDGNFLHSLPVKSPMEIGRCEKYSTNDLKCCFARISVGAMSAACRFPKFCPVGREVRSEENTPELQSQ